MKQLQQRQQREAAVNGVGNQPLAVTWIAHLLGILYVLCIVKSVLCRAPATRGGGIADPLRQCGAASNADVLNS